MDAESVELGQNEENRANLGKIQEKAANFALSAPKSAEKGKNFEIELHRHPNQMPSASNAGDFNKLKENFCSILK